MFVQLNTTAAFPSKQSESLQQRSQQSPSFAFHQKNPESLSPDFENNGHSLLKWSHPLFLIKLTNMTLETSIDVALDVGNDPIPKHFIGNFLR